MGEPMTDFTPQEKAKRAASRKARLKAAKPELKVKSWKTQFFEVKKIGDEPPLMTEGFWPKPDHKRFNRPTDGRSKKSSHKA